MKIGISCSEILAKLGTKEGLKHIKNSGFDAVDLNVTSYFADRNSIFYNGSEDEILSYFDNIKKICNDFEIDISQTHGLFTVTVPDSEETENLNRGAEIVIKATSLLGAPYCVFHNTKLRQWEKVCLEPEFILKKNKDFFQDVLTPICEKYNVKFALETHGRTILEDGSSMLDFLGDGYNLKKSFDEIKSDYKAFCLDTGHTNEAHYYGGPTVVDTIKILDKDIKVLHLHDNQGFYDSHLLPLPKAYGAIDWSTVFDTLEEVGYQGVYNWELNLAYFGNYIEKALPFIGGYLKNFMEYRGKING